MRESFFVIVNTPEKRWKAKTTAESAAKALNQVRYRFCRWAFGENKKFSFEYLAQRGITFKIESL